MNRGDQRDDGLPGFETICAHWGENRELYQGAVIPPIFQNSLFTFPDCESRDGSWSLAEHQRALNGASSFSAVYDYTRVSNPTTDIAEAKIAALEGGERARCFGSGMAAISAAILACVKAGDHVIAPDAVYGPTRVFLSSYLRRFDISVTFVEGSDPAEYEAALQARTSLLYLESPSSLVMRQQDIHSVAAIASAHGAATICDNSWASPYFQNPLRFGVDMVVHSATKYLGGHSDIVAGVAVGSEARIRSLVLEEGCLLGAVLDPFASWLLIRGLRTLAVRMERHQQNALEIASRLHAHPAVDLVLFPGGPQDPQQDLTERQLRGSSSLFSIRLKDRSLSAARKFVNGLKYFGIGCSWGGFESLAQPVGIPGRLIDEPDAPQIVVRIHVGLENVEDLWSDIESALRS